MAEENVESREEKARNSTSSEELKKLSEDDESYVRSIVSENLNTPSSVLEKLADDDDYSVRNGVAQNKNTPVSVMKKLVSCDFKYFNYCNNFFIYQYLYFRVLSFYINIYYCCNFHDYYFNIIPSYHYLHYSKVK